MVLGLHSGRHVGQAGTTWVHRCPGWQLPTFPYLGEKTIPRSYRILGTPQYKRMKVTGQVWHRCEPGSHSICQAVLAVAQGWVLCLSIQRAGQEALVSAWLWLLQLALGLLGGIVLSLISTETRRLPRTLVTDLYSHTVHAALSCGHCKIQATPN